MSRDAKRAQCPHCGMPLDGPDSQPAGGPGAPLRYDLEKLAAVAGAERAYDETVKVRVTQEDIRKLVDKRRKRRAT